ncbi:TetR/AcrR family transcriptional regulator [Rhodococcus erythropolis]|uniref:TetR/AcrR family transcriptional regulator n=1 Tax=Rhodococcus baikonurensis TaxID=172041 RepID=UPI002626AFAE|nr:TetR/AcrR family transcriptional regulator C-terminal domain-containing protein [uncultured Rhodococcus sp.]
MTAPSPDKKPTATSQRRRSYNTGITADAVLTVALGLSREHGVEGWSLRQLLGELDTSFSVVYRLVGDRDALSAAVVDRAISAVSVPSAERDWRQWLTHLLVQMREALVECPGAAQWLLMNGVATERSRELMEAGLASLTDAGFGAEAAQAYTVAFTSTTTLIAMHDARRIPSGEPSPDHGAMLDQLSKDGPTDPRSSMEALIGKFAGPPDTAEATRAEHYRYTLDRVLDGLEARLDAIKESRK